MTGFPINSMNVGENVAPLLSGVCVLANSKHHTLHIIKIWHDYGPKCTVSTLLQVLLTPPGLTKRTIPFFLLIMPVSPIPTPTGERCMGVHSQNMTFWSSLV